jgi:hypothetical protein
LKKILEELGCVVVSVARVLVYRLLFGQGFQLVAIQAETPGPFVAGDSLLDENNARESVVVYE